MYGVLDVCRYVINYSAKYGGISNLKLQKILYFIQAQFLISKNKACFHERIEAWDFGPVVPKAYHEYKQYGAMTIPIVGFYFEADSNNLWSVEKKIFDENIISKNDRKTIDYVVDLFANYSATSLVDLTHRQDPWKNNYYAGVNCIITNDEIKRYFDGKQ